MRGAPAFRPSLFAVAVLAAIVVERIPTADAAGKSYQKGHQVELWVSKVGPYANPQEAYEYYTLPYCAPDTEHHPETGSSGLFNTLKSTYLGESLGGHALRHTGHDLKFAPDTSDGAIVEECTTKPLSREQAAAFVKAAEDQWFYQMYLDDLPIWGMVGEVLPASAAAAMNKSGKKGESDFEKLEEEAAAHRAASGAGEEELKAYVYTERTLTIDYNKDRVIKVDLTSDPASLVEIKPGTPLKFRMFIKWQRTNAEFHSRFDRYLDHAFFKHQIHWFSIFNSFMMVMFLTGLVALILLRTLRKDYARYSMGHDLELAAGGGGEDDEEEYDDDGKPLIRDSHGPGGASEESGWKQVHGDVFRAPRLLPLFAALLGTGWQLVVLTLGVILYAVAGPLHGAVHEERGEVLHSMLWSYVFSSIVAGYTSGSYFKRYFATTNPRSKGGIGVSSGSAGATPMPAGTSVWQATMFLTVVLLPTVAASILSVLNFISLVYGTISYIPFMVILKVFLIYIFMSVPLTIFGTLLGRHAKLAAGGKGGKGGPVGEHFPCRVNAIPRPIPDEGVPWFGRPQNLVPFAGLLSFGSIFIELYYILTSLWNYKYYHVYGFLLGVYAILIVVVCMTTIIVVYFCLNAENYLWQWTAFASGASTAGYVFLYGVYYYIFKTGMHGFLQTSFYFGYMALIALNLGLLCGTIGHFAASKFVRAIFQNVKVD